MSSSMLRRTRSFFRQNALGIGHADGAAGKAGDDLLDNADGLADFLAAALITGVAIAFVGDRHVELVFLVAQVRLVLAEIVRDAGSAEIGSGDAVTDRLFLGDRADADRAIHENLVPAEQSVELIDDGL